CPAAGKTGTTDNFNDAWFVGFTPTFSTAAWVGYPNALREMRSVHGISVAGGTFPAEIWHKFMEVAKGPACGDFKQPSTPMQWSSFFGKYSTQGNYSSTPTYNSSAPPIKTEKKNKGKSPGDTTGGGYGGYDPRLYEVPKTPKPPKLKKPKGGNNFDSGGGGD